MIAIDNYSIKWKMDHDLVLYLDVKVFWWFSVAMQTNLRKLSKQKKWNVITSKNTFFYKSHLSLFQIVSFSYL